MYYQKIASNLRLTSAGNGVLADFELDPIWGGHTMKQVNFQIIVRQTSSTAAKIGITLRHGPDGKNFLDHSTPIPSTALAAQTVVLNGDSDITKMLGEVLLPVPTAESTGATQEWAVVDIYLVAKPF